MTDETKKALYGAARKQHINKIRNDVVAECLPLMSVRGPVPMTFIGEDGKVEAAVMDATDVILFKIHAAAFTVMRLEAGMPA